MMVSVQLPEPIRHVVQEHKVKPGRALMEQMTHVLMLIEHRPFLVPKLEQPYQPVLLHLHLHLHLLDVKNMNDTIE